MATLAEPMSLATPREHVLPPARAAVFLDQDGTLVEDVPHNVDPGQLRFTRGALPALRALADAGYALVVVTNQPGIALGRFRRAEFQRLEDALRARVRDESGVTLTAVMVCPHAPPTSVSSCLCRKPAPGLLRQAAVAHRLDLGASWMVGDILDDVEAGLRARTRALLLDVGSETEWRLSPLRTPERRCADLLEAASHILRTGAQVRLASPPGDGDGHGTPEPEGLHVPRPPTGDARQALR